jgi:TatD DNase family protein
MISIGSSILTNKTLQEIITEIPNSSLFLETDDSKIDIFDIYKKVSEIKKISLQELEEIIEQNFKRTFTKWHIG